MRHIEQKVRSEPAHSSGSEAGKGRQTVVPAEEAEEDREEVVQLRWRPRLRMKETSPAGLCAV